MLVRMPVAAPSTGRKHTIRVLLPDPRAHKRSKETHHLIQRLISALKKRTIRVLLQSRLVLPTGTKGVLCGHDSCPPATVSPQRFPPKYFPLSFPPPFPAKCRHRPISSRHRLFYKTQSKVGMILT